MSEGMMLDLQVRARFKRGRYRTIGTMSVPISRAGGLSGALGGALTRLSGDTHPTVVENKTGQAEPILTGEQWDAATKAARGDCE